MQTRQAIQRLGVALCTVAIFISFAVSTRAADTPSKEATLEQRVADLEAYINNANRTANVTSHIAGPGPGHNSWMMVSAALVLFMTLPGLALFYGGLVRRKNVLSVLAQCLGLAGLDRFAMFSTLQHRLEAIEPKPGFLLFRPVATDAVLVENGPHFTTIGDAGLG